MDNKEEMILETKMILKDPEKKLQTPINHLELGEMILTDKEEISIVEVIGTEEKVIEEEMRVKERTIEVGKEGNIDKEKTEEIMEMIEETEESTDKIDNRDNSNRDNSNRDNRDSHVNTKNQRNRLNKNNKIIDLYLICYCFILEIK